MCSKSNKTLSEQRKIVKSLNELLENEKSILEKLEPNENPKELEIADALIDELLCPISYSFMTDPVVLTSGKTYDRTAITAEFKRQKEQYPEKIVKCPFTTITQVTDFLIPNMQMRSITAKFVEKYKNNTYTGPNWNEIRRLCLDYLEEQKPQKVKERQRADEQRFEEQQRIQEEFEKQKKEFKQRAEYGFELEEFFLLYGDFFRFYQKSPKSLYTGYANKNKFQRNYHTNMDILKKWEQNTKMLPNKKISGCLYIFMEYYFKKNLIIN